MTTTEPNTDFMARGELPQSVDFDGLWPAEPRAEIIAVETIRLQ